MIRQLTPVVRTINVQVPPERAFEVFTQKLGEWWPLHLHGVFDDAAQTAIVEPRVGGRVYEVSRSGDESTWAEVTAYDPPRRLGLSWHPNPAATVATDVEITFEPDGDGTRVRLTHTGWERLGDIAAEARESYNEGWVPTLAAFADFTTDGSA